MPLPRRSTWSTIFLMLISVTSRIAQFLPSFCCFHHVSAFRFTFPKYSAKTFVTKVTVSFEDIRFVVPLKIGDVKAEVTNTLENDYTEVWVFFSLILFHALFTSGIGNCSYSIGSKHHPQQPTKHSILLKSESKVDSASWWRFECFPVGSRTEDEVSQTCHSLYYSKAYW